jgi:hypothetical protein
VAVERLPLAAREHQAVGTRWVRAQTFREALSDDVGEPDPRVPSDPSAEPTSGVH